MGGIKPSSVDPSLPDNRAELEAAKDAAKESTAESAAKDAQARDDAKTMTESVLKK